MLLAPLIIQDAAGLVAPDNPIALGLAAEVGVNAYAIITLPGILMVCLFMRVCRKHGTSRLVSNKIRTAHIILYSRASALNGNSTQTFSLNLCLYQYLLILYFPGEENHKDDCSLLLSRVLPCL